MGIRGGQPLAITQASQVAIYINTSRQVAFGHVEPSQTLDVSGNIAATGNLSITGAGGFGGNVLIGGNLSVTTDVGIGGDLKV